MNEEGRPESRTAQSEVANLAPIVSPQPDADRASKHLPLALALIARGLNPLPAGGLPGNSPKSPGVAWKRWQTEQVTEAQARQWFRPERPDSGIGLVTGFGRLVLTELEGAAIGALADIEAEVDAEGLAHVWRAMSAWSEWSPSGGLHLLHLLDGPVPPSRKLARAADGATLAETKDAEGFVVLAPSPGALHDSGRRWRRRTGGPETIGTVAPQDREAVHRIITKVLHEQPGEPSRLRSGQLDDVAPGLTVAEWVAALADGEPTQRVLDALAAVTPEGMSHDDMLRATSQLVALGSNGEPGVGRALALGRSTYTRDYPRHGKAWDDAVAGSVRRFGQPVDFMTGKQAEPSAVKATDTADAGGGAGTPESAEAAFDRDVAARARSLEVDATARERVAAERTKRVVLPPIQGLDDLLAEPDEDAEYRVADLWPAGGTVMLVAAQKAGKSTLVANLVRSIADGTPFLGRFETRPGAVVLLDLELDRRQIRRNLAPQRIEHPERVRVVSLRGHTASLDITNPTRRAEVADRIRGAEVVILDPLRPLIDALGLSEDKDSGRLLVAFDALLAEAGISEGMIVQHTGHVRQGESGERARGDSRLRDWPDASWTLVRERDEDDFSKRYLRAFGRDVALRESALDYDEGSRRLTIAGGSRAENAASEVVPDVRAVLMAADQPMNRRDLEAALAQRGHPRRAIRDAIEVAVRRNFVLRTTGPNRSVLHSAAPLARAA